MYRPGLPDDARLVAQELAEEGQSEADAIAELLAETAAARNVERRIREKERREQERRERQEARNQALRDIQSLSDRDLRKLIRNPEGKGDLGGKNVRNVDFLLPTFSKARDMTVEDIVEAAKAEKARREAPPPSPEPVGFLDRLFGGG